MFNITWKLDFSTILGFIIAALIIVFLPRYIGNKSVSHNEFDLIDDKIRIDKGRAMIYKSPSSTKIICVEPLPDIGFSETAKLTLKAEGEGISSNASSEYISDMKKLFERANSIQLLRDVLYRNCEALANGAIDPKLYRVIFEKTAYASTYLLAADVVSTAQGANQVVVNDFTNNLLQLLRSEIVERKKSLVEQNIIPIKIDSTKEDPNSKLERLSSDLNRAALGPSALK